MPADSYCKRCEAEGTACTLSQSVLRNELGGVLGK
eukprot:gene185-11046_t